MDYAEYVWMVMLAEHGADILPSNMPRMFETSVRCENIKWIQKLIHMGFDVNHQFRHVSYLCYGFEIITNKKGQVTALQIVALNGSVEVATLLLKSGAVPNAKKINVWISCLM